MVLKEKEGKYMTYNMGLAACLEIVGYVCEVKATEGVNRVEFWFKVDEDLNDTVENFYNRKLSVEPREFVFSLKSVKDKMFEARDNVTK